MSQSVVTALFLVLLLFLGIAMYTHSSVQKKLGLEEFNKHFSLYQHHSQALDAALRVVENSTGRQFGDLLASTAYYHGQLPSVGGEEVDVLSEFSEVLNASLGGVPHSFKVIPEVKSLKISFLVSTVSAMEAPYAVLQRDFPQLLVSLKRQHPSWNVTGGVVLVSDASWCPGLFISCQVLTPSQFYFNNRSTDLEELKWRNKLFRPLAGLNESTDWETALSYYLLTKASNDLSSLELVFPLVNSLPAASQSNPCPSSYASSVLARDNSLVKSQGFIVNPVIINPSPCPSELDKHLNELVNGTVGEVTFYKQNFLSSSARVVESVLSKLVLTRGDDEGGGLVVERRIPAPNGGKALIRLKVYS